MRKKLLYLLGLMQMTSAMYAQSSLLAALNHDGEISVFYGLSALRDAHKSAVSGDVITLSSGTFTATDITKAVTIRGAGMAIGSKALTEPTIITGNFNINIPTDDTNRLTLDGLYSNYTIEAYGTLNNATFLKCRFKVFKKNSVASVNNLTFLHCFVSDELFLGGSYSAMNSVIRYPRAESTGSAEFLNCVIINNYINNMKNASIRNCIINTQGNNTTYFDSSCVVYNSVAIGQESAAFEFISNTTNTTLNFEDVFKTYTGGYNDDETFELTEEAKSTLRGLDGTEVGIYGGNMPYSVQPTNPQIMKCNVAEKSNADGMLSVELEISIDQ